MVILACRLFQNLIEHTKNAGAAMNLIQQKQIGKRGRMNYLSTFQILIYVSLSC